MKRVLAALGWLVCTLALAIAADTPSRPSPAIEALLPPLPPDPRPRDAALVVRVRANERPVVAARVRALAIRDERAFLAGEAPSDARGEARIDRLAAGEHWITVEAQGFARASTAIVVAAGERGVTLELLPEHRLTVDVQDEDGRGIAGAEVEATGDDPLPVGARTDGGGQATLTRLAGTKWFVVARARGFDEVAQRGVREGERPKIVLRRLGAFAVTVLGPGGDPARGARVHIAGARLWPARVADVDDRGEVRIGGLSAGAYALRATKESLASPIELGASVGRGEEKRVTLKLGPGVTVVVHVTDGEGERADAVPGARVTLTEAGVSPFPVEGTTDRAGRARLGPVAPGALAIAARAEGFVARGAVAVPDPPPAEVRVPLSRAGVLAGRVVDARGFAVDGASIVVVGTDFQGAPIDEDPRRSRFREAHFAATLAGPRPLIPAGELGVMPGPVPPIPHAFSLTPELPAAAAPAVPDEPWVTRADGSFRAAPVSPGRVRALVRHAQYIDALSDVVTLASTAEARVEVVMRAGGSVEGRVVDPQRRPVGGARVTIAATRGSMERSALTAGDGSFAFAAVPESITLFVSRPEDALELAGRTIVEVGEGQRRSLEVVLQDPRPPIPVRVVDDRGYAVDAAQLTLLSLDPAVPLRATVFTDARGDASLPGARGLSARVEVSAPGRAGKVVAIDPDTDRLRVELHAAERLEGEVRSTRGEAVKGAQIVLYTELGARHALGDAQGRFVIGELSPGKARMHVRAVGYAPLIVEAVVQAHGGARATAAPRAELSPEGFAEGTVVDDKGDPVQGARVAKDLVPVYLAVGTAPVDVAVTDAKGRFRLAGLPEGSLALEAYAADVGRGRAEGVRIVAGRATDGVRVALRRSEGDRARESAARGGVAVTLGETGGDAPEVVVVAVADGSEAERGGLAPGDVLLTVGGAAVKSIADARARLSGPIVDDVVVRVRRLDRTLALRLAREQVHR
jgi:hypothetical protein